VPVKVISVDCPDHLLPWKVFPPPPSVPDATTPVLRSPPVGTETETSVSIDIVQRGDPVPRPVGPPPGARPIDAAARGAGPGCCGRSGSQPTCSSRSRSTSAAQAAFASANNRRTCSRS